MSRVLGFLQHTVDWVRVTKFRGAGIPRESGTWNNHGFDSFLFLRTHPALANQLCMHVCTLRQLSTREVG